MQNAGLNESQAGIKIARRNINNLRYADDTTLTAESKEELKRLLVKVKEESEKAGLKLNIQKTKIMTSSPIESESEVAQSCPTLCNPMACSLPGFSVHGILQARILEWVAISLSRGSSQPRDQIQVSHIAGRRMANRWGKCGNCQILFSWAPKSLWTVTVAMKLKHTCSLEEKL